MALFDLRNKSRLFLDIFKITTMLLVRPVQKYKGCTGSIRSIYAHPTEPFVASCGIDRFVMVHNVETRKVVNKVSTDSTFFNYQFFRFIARHVWAVCCCAPKTRLCPKKQKTRVTRKWSRKKLLSSLKTNSLLCWLLFVVVSVELINKEFYVNWVCCDWVVYIRVRVILVCTWSYQRSNLQRIYLINFIYTNITV